MNVTGFTPPVAMAMTAAITTPQSGLPAAPRPHPSTAVFPPHTSQSGQDSVVQPLYNVGVTLSSFNPGYLLNPYLLPYLLPGASQQISVHTPFRCEIDHQHPPKQSCSTSKRKLTIYDLEVHMRYVSAASVTVEDIIGGNLSLLESMLRQGVDCSGYVRHIRFLVEKSKVYVPSALIGYDTEMRERAEVFGSSVFSYGDHDLSHRWLGVKSLKPVSSQGSAIGSSKKKSKSTKFGSCWAWNEDKSCKSTPCKFKHLCWSCQGEHKSSDCSKTPAKAK